MGRKEAAAISLDSWEMSPNSPYEIVWIEINAGTVRRVARRLTVNVLTPGTSFNSPVGVEEGQLRFWLEFSGLSGRNALLVDEVRIKSPDGPGGE